MALLQNLTDDQTALLGCAGVLLVAFVTMTLSYHVGVIVRGGRARPARVAKTLPEETNSQQSVERRAA